MNNNQKLILKSIIDTKKLAELLSKNIKKNTFILLSGNLGAGKTTFVKFLALSLGIKENVNSPTFVLMNVYNIPNKRFNLIHIDGYRLNKNDNYFDFQLESENNFTIIEWPENIFPFWIKRKFLEIKFSFLNFEERFFEIKKNQFFLNYYLKIEIEKLFSSYLIS
jgi:tRNA threonylcarbamoyladenosine biosynthesis protein TsaE